LNLTAASADCGSEQENHTNVPFVHDLIPFMKFFSDPNKGTPRAGQGLEHNAASRDDPPFARVLSTREFQLHHLEVLL
jgi:hypothetical protein